jgi:hypothetical protein
LIYPENEYVEKYFLIVSIITPIITIVIVSSNAVVFINMKLWQHAPCLITLTAMGMTMSSRDVHPSNASSPYRQSRQSRASVESPTFNLPDGVVDYDAM